MDDRDSLRTMALARAAFGATCVLLPKLAGRAWLGPGGTHGATRAAVRSFGVRDMALGVLMLDALDEGKPVRPLAELTLVSDAVDMVGAVLAGNDVPLTKRLATALAAGTAVYVGTRALDAFG